MVPGNIHTHPTEGHWKFLGVRGGGLKAKFFEAMYDNKLELPGGEGGMQNNRPSIGGVWIFSGTAQCNSIDIIVRPVTVVTWQKVEDLSTCLD